MAAPKKYRPIRGLGKPLLTSSFSTNHSLWIGDNHLLSIKRFPFWEEYRRFYLKDIQAVICRKTHSGLIYNILFGALAGLGLLLLFTDFTSIFGWIWVGLMVLGLIWNLIIGPTCICHIQTAAQVEKLPRLNRFKRADRFIRVLRPLVEGVQGGPWNPAHALAVSSPGPSRHHTDANPIKREPGLFHLILFILFMIRGLRVVADLYYDHTMLYLLGSILAVACGALTIICLIKQKRSNLDPWIQRLVWGCLAYFVCWFGMSIVFSVFLLIERPEVYANTWLMIQAAVEYSPGDVMWLQYYYFIDIIVLLGLSLPGLLLVDRHRREQARLISMGETG